MKITDYKIEGRKGISVFMFDEERGKNEGGPSAGIVRCAPGIVTLTHLHPGRELVILLANVDTQLSE